MRLIDADALPTLATELRLNNGKTKHFVGVEFDDIRNAPTIDPVRHGRWVLDTEHREEIYVPPVTCSACWQTGVLEYGTLTPYCPNCGAKMDGGEHETD